MDTTSPDVGKFEIGVMQKDANGHVVQRLIEGDELKKLLDEAKVFEEMKKK